MPIPTEDPTQTMTLDEKIQPQTLGPTADLNIDEPVTPGHDMVVNHLDGNQELGTGNEAVAVAAAEAKSGEHVAVSEVKVPAETTSRSAPDPEVNGLDQQTLVAEKVAPAKKK